jgi:hypothetical protein
VIHATTPYRSKKRRLIRRSFDAYLQRDIFRSLGLSQK